VTTHPCIERVIAYIHEHLDERLSLGDLAAEAGLSVWRFCVVFREHTGVSPRRYVWAQRVRQAQSLLAAGESAAAAALRSGFYDQSHLCRHFRSNCGMTPGEYASGRRSAALEAA
jgi:AraC-like DNA-binding protein